MLHYLGAKGLNIRAKLDAIDKADRPELRRCTVRGHDAERGMLTFDVVTHGESGPGSAWALHAQTGDEVGIRAMTSTWRRKAGIQLLVADSTSAPAMRGILLLLPRQGTSGTRLPGYARDSRSVHRRGVGGHPRADSGAEPDLLEPGYDSFRSELASYKEHFVPEGAEAAAAAAALRRGGKLAVAYAWLCGEASLAKETRKVVKEWGVPRTDVLFSGYYRRR